MTYKLLFKHDYSSKQVSIEEVLSSRLINNDFEKINLDNWEQSLQKASMKEKNFGIVQFIALSLY